MLVAFNQVRQVKATWRKSQLRRPSRAHARYSNDREFSTRQHAGKSPSVLKGNRKRIGKKAARGKKRHAESLRVAEAPLNAQGGCTPREAPPDKRPARKSCGAPSESRPARKPQSTQPESWLARKPITASDERAKPQTGAGASEAKTTRYHGASRDPNAVVVVSAMYENDKRCRRPACTARISSSKRAA